MAGNTFVKDPSAVLDYAVDWTTWLGTDTISTATWSVATGLTSGTASVSGGTATIWLAGGQAGSNYPVTCQVVTGNGRTDERTILIQCQNR